MKKLMKRLCAAMLMTALLASNALALSVDPIDPGSSFSDEIIEAETLCNKFAASLSSDVIEG